MANPRVTITLQVSIYDSVLMIMTNPVGRVLCSLENVLSLAKSKCQEEGCSGFYAVKIKFHGSCLIIDGECPAGHQYLWKSSSEQANKKGSKIYVDNLALASAVILSGNNFSKLLTFFRFLSVPIINLSTFHTYQRLFICPSIDKYYIKEQV